MAFVTYEGADAEMNPYHLPESVGAWSRPESSKIIEPTNIFKYMNGAGELYLGYRFDHLEVFDYMSENQDNILVELYFMETSDDAFGLLSLDWGGEPISFSESSANTSNPSLASPPGALYGAGLLRVWSDNLYARVMAYRETPASKRAVLALGQAIAANQKKAPPPDLASILAPQVGSDWKLRDDRLSFFRSYLVLNSIYYLSEKNILDLGLSTEAIMAPYENISGPPEGKRSHLLLVKYVNRQRARKALDHFHDIYLPEYRKEFATASATKNPSTFELEDGWLAYQLIGNHIIVVFECPDQESARQLIQKNEANLLKRKKKS